MTRAFRGGIDSRKKVRAPTRIRNWNPIRDLRGLKTRTTAIGNEMGPLVDVPAMIRIEDEHWVFERVEAGVLQNQLIVLLFMTQQAQPQLAPLPVWKQQCK